MRNDVYASGPIAWRAAVLLLAWTWLGSGSLGSSVPPFRPAPGKGPGASTLLLYSDMFAPYSLVNALEALGLQLRRVDITLETAPLESVSEERLGRADYLVVFCPQKPAALPIALRNALAATNRPVLWVGWGAERLGRDGPAPGGFRVRTDEPLVQAGAIRYREQTWMTPPSWWLPVELVADPGVETIMTLADAGPPDRLACWRAGHITFFGTVPVEGPLTYLFNDMLLDFFGVTQTAPPCVLLRIDDYHPLSDHHAFLRMVDFLYSRLIPFAVSVTPASLDPATDRIEDLSSRPEFVLALRYAQQRGGRLLLCGCLRQPEETGEFWNTDLDRPLGSDVTGYTRACLEKACRQLVQHGLLPLAWETPHYAASSAATAEIAKFFSSAVERVQLSDTTRQALSAPPSLTLDQFGRLIVPENLGPVSSSAADPLDSLVRQSRSLLGLRGTVAGCSFHAYLPLDRLVRLVDHLESVQPVFLDLLDLDHWVRWPGGLLLTGRAQVQTRLGYGPVRYRAFDRAGRLVGDTTARTLFSGDRLFERRGLGAVELFEVMEDKP